MNTQMLKQIIYTLGNLEVHGKENLSRLLGCIEALEDIVRFSEQPAVPGEPEEVADG